MGEKWDYCRIEYRIHYRGEDFTRSGMKQMWLQFLAIAEGYNKTYIAGKSIELPLPSGMVNAPIEPQRNDIGHKNAHQNLISSLKDDGWEQLPFQGNAWWEKRLRRPLDEK